MQNLDDENPAVAAAGNFDTSVKDVDRVDDHSNKIRAEQNIAEWRKYLPADCVEAMVRDGWHLRL